jgi:hypothetical protein
MSRANTKTTYFPLGGGLDIVTPALSVKPGMALSLSNYEPWFNGGYRRVSGFEVFDGHPKPSEQTFIGFEVSDASGLSIGDAVTGDTSGATGTVIGIWVDDGTYGADSIGVTKVTGTFVDGEGVNTAAFTIDSAPVQRFAPSAEIEDTWLLEAQDEYRADIAAIPGANAARGAWQRGANTYAVRDNVGATAGILHLGSSSGWTTTGITMADYLHFDAGGGGGGTSLPVEGEAIFGNTSGATAVIHRVLQFGGSSSGNDAVGYFVLINVVGGPFQDNEKIRRAAAPATDVADAKGASATFAFSPGGIYQFINHNFFGGSATYRTYGVNGVDVAFEIDESNIVSPIFIATLADLQIDDPTEDVGPPDTSTPFLLEEHRNHLFFAYEGGSLVQSVVGEPMLINGFLGAAEFGIGDEVTGLNSVVGGVLVVTSERETRGLFGKNISDWEMKLIGEKTGGKLYTSKKMDTVYSLDDLGITSVARTDAFGSFAGATVSQLVQPIVNLFKARSTTGSITRNSNQYRLYFDDGSALVMFIPTAGSEVSNRAQTRTRVEFGQLSYPITVRQMYDTESDTGEEAHYFISDDGFIRQDQVGNNFDGGVVRSTVRLVYNQIGSPSYQKKFRRAVLEMESQKPLVLRVIYDLSYGGAGNKSGNELLSVEAGGGLWDVDNWDEFFWDGQTVSEATVGLGGSGTNISLLVFNESATARPFVLQGLTLHYDLRRLQR